MSTMAAVPHPYVISNFSHFRHHHQILIHNDHHGGHLEGLQLLSAPEPYVGWSGNFVEGIGAALRFRIDKMVPFWYPRWPPWQPSWKSSNHICSWTISLTELKLEGDIGHWGNSELLKSFCCNIQDGGHGGHLQTVSQIEPKFDGRHRGDSELLNHLVPISKMAAMVAILKLFKH